MKKVTIKIYAWHFKVELMQLMFGKCTCSVNYIRKHKPLFKNWSQVPIAHYKVYTPEVNISYNWFFNASSTIESRQIYNATPMYMERIQYHSLFIIVCTLFTLHVRLYFHVRLKPRQIIWKATRCLLLTCI